MNMTGFFVQAIVYLGASLLMVPIAKRLGLGSVLGYLLAGVLVGPFGLDLVGEASADVMHFAEFGVVMMLFLVGLELEPALLWRMRAPILGMGGLQVGGTAALLGLGGVVLGLPWQQAVALGLILSMSSTAIALQSLQERGLMRADAGQKSFAVLLFQDIAVIPMLALFPLLATLTPSAVGGDGHGSLLEHFPGWQRALITLGAIGGVIGAGRLVVPPLMRLVARTGLREMFTTAALAIVIAVTVLMSMVGLSAALGTFLAGVVLANSEYRHELESDIDPFKGLLLGLFFMAVGASIDFSLVASSPLQIGAILLGITLLKVALLFGLARAFRSPNDQSATFAIALGQIGEFAFVLLAFAQASGVLPLPIASMMVAVTALSMGASPLLLALNERFVLPRLARVPAAREADVEDHGAEVLVAGYGRFGQIATRFLRAHGHSVTMLDIDSDQIEVVKRFGARVFFGDASRLDLLRAAGAANARVLLVAVDEPTKVLEIAHVARTHFPHLAILARARGRSEAMDLTEAGIEGVYRETFDTSLRMGVDALRLLGSGAHEAERAARTFRRHDEALVEENARLRAADQATYLQSTRAGLNMLETVLKADRAKARSFVDDGWDVDAARARSSTAATPSAPEGGSA
jgi:monovalent cation:proton antiporter-2 (CPA2) family protein